MHDIGKRILRHLRRCRVVCSEVPRDPAVGLTATGAEPGRPDTAWRPMRLIAESDTFSYCLRHAGTSASRSWEVVGVVGIEGRWTIVHLACSQAARPRVPVVGGIGPGECRSIVHGESLRKTPVDLRVVIPLDPAIDPNGKC